MIINFKIFEKVNDYFLYHFTSLYSLKKILNQKRINPSLDGVSGYGISTTRYKNLAWLNGIRLTFDKRELQQHYKIKPSHWFNQIHPKDYRQFGPNITPDPKNITHYQRVLFY